MAAFSYFTASVAWTASVIFSIIMLGLVGYLTAILEIFSTAFWTKSFLMMDGELGEEKDKKE